MALRDNEPPPAGPFEPRSLRGYGERGILALQAPTSMTCYTSLRKRCAMTTPFRGTLRMRLSSRVKINESPKIWGLH